jgi:hypothetical protein
MDIASDASVRAATCITHGNRPPAAAAAAAAAVTAVTNAMYSEVECVVDMLQQSERCSQHPAPCLLHARLLKPMNEDHLKRHHEVILQKSLSLWDSPILYMLGIMRSRPCRESQQAIHTQVAV